MALYSSTVFFLFLEMKLFILAATSSTNTSNFCFAIFVVAKLNEKFGDNLFRSGAVTFYGAREQRRISKFEHYLLCFSVVDSLLFWGGWLGGWVGWGGWGKLSIKSISAWLKLKFGLSLAIIHFKCYL